GEDPGLAEEVLHGGEKGQHGPRPEENAHEAIELLALPDQVHHEQVDAGIAEEEQQRARGLRGRYGAEEEKARGKDRGAGGGRGEGPLAQRSVADHELEQDERDEKGERLVEGRGIRLELASIGHGEPPCEKPNEDEQLSDHERPAPMRAACQRGPKERGVENHERDGPEWSSPALTCGNRWRRRHGGSAGTRHCTRRV